MRFYMAAFFIVFACASFHSACAAEIKLPVTVNIVQCGTKNEIQKTCHSDSRCCVFIDGSYESHAADGQFPETNEMIINNNNNDAQNENSSSVALLTTNRNLSRR